MMLPTAPAGRRESTGVVVVGTGAAGLSVLLHLAAAGVDCVAVSRGEVTDSATAWAQGGLAAVWDGADSFDAHIADTLEAGAGLCDEAAVTDLVTAAPDAIRRLIDLGARFDRTAGGDLDLHLEGGHSARRIVHADGDASGAEVERTLWAALQGALGASGTSVRTHTRLVDVLTDVAGRACGVRLIGPDGRISDLMADAVVLATGGLGQLWPVTSNPVGATGDGVAAALRAGALIQDLEFVQFHPTVLADADAATRGVLISEAVRGEGAFLVDGTGRRIMAGRHPLADLAPRDVVSAAIIEHLAATGEPHAFLDATGFGARSWDEHFPGILRLCRERGVDPVIDPIPVHPAAHYSCGGVAATLDGVTSVPGLFAVGEVASTGVHGANRLASNSLTEALVAGDRLGALLAPGATAPAAARLSGVVPPSKAAGSTARSSVGTVSPTDLPSSVKGPAARPGGGIVSASVLPVIRAAMQEHTFVSRSADGLRRSRELLAGVPRGAAAIDDITLTATNLHLVASALAEAAVVRTESRGCHRRTDHPETSPAWARRVGITLDAEGVLTTIVVPQAADRPLATAQQNAA